MKIVRCSLASQPNTGHVATSLLATNTTGVSAVMIQISSHEAWLLRIRIGIVGAAFADLCDADAEQRAKRPVIEVRHAALPAIVQCDADQLKRQQGQRQHDQREKGNGEADHAGAQPEGQKWRWRPYSLVTMAARKDSGRVGSQTAHRQILRALRRVVVAAN